MSLLYVFVRTTIRISPASCVTDHSFFLTIDREDTEALTDAAPRLHLG
jgi:hypothetical protein